MLLNGKWRRMEQKRWYVMRDLKRANAGNAAFRLLEEAGLEVFTPREWRVRTRRGKRVRECVAVLPDLLFVHASREELAPYLEKIPTLQYRYLRGGYCRPMVVADAEMERFIRAAALSEEPRYYLPDEITGAMRFRHIRVVGGPLDGYEGRLLSVRGSKVRRLMVELPGFLSVAVEVSPEMVEVLEQEETAAGDRK